MEDQQHDQPHSAAPAPTAQGPHHEPARSTSSSPSPAPMSASSQTAAHAVEDPQQPSTTSSDTQHRASLVHAPFSQHDFPVLSSAPHAQPGFGTHSGDDDPQYSMTTQVHMVGGRATFVLPEQRSPASSSCRMTTTSGGAASLAQHGTDRHAGQPSFSWYDPGAVQGPVEQRVQPRSAPAKLLPATGPVVSSSTQSGRRTSDPSTDQDANAARESGSSAGDSGKDGEMNRGVALAGRKRSRDEEQQQPDIVVDSAPSHPQHHLSVGLSVRVSSGEMNDASSATTDDEAVEVQQRETQRRRTESNAQQQHALAAAHGRQPHLAQLYDDFYRQQQQQQQRVLYNTRGFPPPQQMGSSSAWAHPAQPQPPMASYYGQQAYQGAYQGYPTGYSAQSSNQSGEASSASSSSSTSPHLGSTHAGQPRFGYYQSAPQPYYGPQYAPATAASYSAYSPSTAITSPSVQATPAPSERRVSGPPILPAFGAAPSPQQQQQQQQQQHGEQEKQAFGAASSAQVAQPAVADEKPFKRGVKVNNPFTIPTLQGVKPFVTKLRFLMRNADKVGDVICWDESGKVILVHASNERLESEVLPCTFGHSNFNNLKNQFTNYGFLALKDPELSRALNSARSSSSTTAAGASTSTASTSATSSSAPHMPRDVREWKAFVHVHTADDLAVVRAEERARASILRRAEKDKEAAKRAKAAEKNKDDSLSGMAAAAAATTQQQQQGELSGDSDEEEDSEDEQDDDEPWFSRDGIDDLRLLRRVRAKSSKGKGKADTSGAAAGGGGGGGATGAAAGSSAGSSSTVLGSNISQAQSHGQPIAPRPASTAQHSSASTSTFPLPPAQYPAIPLRSSAKASSTHLSTTPTVPPPQVEQPQTSTPAQSEARGAESAHRVNTGALLGMRRGAVGGAGQGQ
ncbi:hypothetical protein JCM3775_006511 [Rhodotorula graminis]